MDNEGFVLKHVYPSELGLHIEHYTEAEAQAAYGDAKSKGANVRLDGLIVTFQFHNPRKPRPVALPTERGRSVLKVNPDKSRQLQDRLLRNPAWDKRLFRVRKGALLLSVQT